MSKNTITPKTSKHFFRPGIPDFLMFVIGLGLVFASNLSDLGQSNLSVIDKFSTEVSGEDSKSYVIKNLPSTSDKKIRIVTPYLNSEL